MERLEFPFTRSEYRHVLLARVGRWCVVERVWEGDGKPHLGHYELVRLEERRARVWPDGRETLAREAYPPESAWGTAGWTEPTLRHVRARWERVREGHAELPPWGELGLADDPEGYAAWKEGRLRRDRP